MSASIEILTHPPTQPVPLPSFLTPPSPRACPSDRRRHGASAPINCINGWRAYLFRDQSITPDQFPLSGTAPGHVTLRPPTQTLSHCTDNQSHSIRRQSALPAAAERLRTSHDAVTNLMSSDGTAQYAQCLTQLFTDIVGGFKFLVFSTLMARGKASGV